MKKIVVALGLVFGLTLISLPSFASDSGASDKNGREVTVKEDGSPADSEGAAANQSGRAHYDRNGKADGIVLPIRNASLQAARGTTAITYRGGPVLLAPKVYKIYYGTWSNPCASTDNSTAGVVNNLLGNINTSAWYRTNTSYYSVTAGTLAKNYSTTYLANAGCSYVNAPGASLDYTGGTQVSDVALAQITANGWVPTSQDIYFVLTSADVNVNGFKVSFCGYHGILSSSPVKSQYSFVGDSGANTGCTSSTIATLAPNSNPTADAMVSVIAHELVETVSDPQLNAWYDGSGNENADKCAWYFGTPTANPTNVFTTTGGAKANATAGAFNYFLQENAPANTNMCVSVNPSQLSTVASFTPNTGPSATTVTFTGTGLSGVQVFFNGVAATVASATATSFTAKVPATATTGPITVVSDYGVWVSPTNFTVAVVPAPTITSFTPTTGLVGTAITINGTNFTGATAVKIGTVSIPGFTVVSPTQITATLPTTAKTGAISVTTSGGTATSTSFTVVALPTITSFTPTSITIASVSKSVTITGTNLTGATSVTLTPTTGTNPATVITGLTGVTASKSIFACPANLALGTYKIQITTAVGTSTQSTGTLTIK